MAQYLYIWEQGGGIGHLQRMKTISHALECEGNSIRWCVPREHLATARSYWPNITPNPVLPAVKPSVREPGNMAEVLQNEGWSKPEIIKSLIAEWQQVFLTHKPDRLLLDYAPNALLGAVASNLETNVIGTGFYIPPNTHPLPAFRKDQGVYAERLAWAEQQIVVAVSAALKQGLNGLGDLFHHSNIRNHLLTYPDWDHYSNRESAHYRGLITGFSGQQISWPHQQQRKVFAYLKMFPCLPVLLQAFAALRISAAIHGDDAVAKLVKSMDLQQVSFCEHPLDERSVANAGAAMINHAGHDGTIKAVMAGIALWQLPLNMEQLITAQNAQKLGVAEWHHAQAHGEFEAGLERLFAAQDQRKQAAQRWATENVDMVGNIQAMIHDLR